MKVPRWTTFFADLKRRGVFRVAGVYGAVTFAVLQGVSLLAPVLLLPDWTYRFIGLLLLAGFPVAIALAWTFERSPEGTRVTSPAAPHELAAIAALPRTQRWPSGIFALVGVVLLVVAGWLALRPRQAASAEAIRSVAVLPFKNYSDDPSNEYFSLGLAEELLNVLAKMPGLKVAARTSAFAFKGDVDIREVGAKLGVAAVVEGSVRKSGDSVRVTAQLIQVSDGFHLWSETYNRKLSDIFAVQDEISQNIAQALQIALGGPTDVKPAEARPTDNIEAYQLYLQARHQVAQRTAESISRSIELFKQAVALDPRFAEARAGLALAYVILPGYTSVPFDADSASEINANAALALDQDLAEAHIALSNVHRNRTRWAEATREARAALRLEPQNPTALHHTAVGELGVGRLDSMRVHLERAYSVDPASGVIIGWLSHAHRLTGDKDRALQFVQKSAELGWGAGYHYWCRALIMYDRFTEAEPICERADLQGARPNNFPSARARPRALRVILDAVRDPGRRAALADSITDIGVGVPLQYYVKVGDIEGAFRALDRLLLTKSRPPYNWETVWAVEAAALRRDPRFVAWLEKMGLIDYWKQAGWPSFCAPSGAIVKCS